MLAMLSPPLALKKHCMMCVEKSNFPNKRLRNYFCFVHIVILGVSVRKENPL